MKGLGVGVGALLTGTRTGIVGPRSSCVCPSKVLMVEPTWLARRGSWATVDHTTCVVSEVGIERADEPMLCP